MKKNDDTSNLIQIDYLKIVDIVADLLDVSKKFEYNAATSNNNIIEISSLHKSGKEVSYKLVLSKFRFDMLIAKKFLFGQDVKKWISRFEFDLEQGFFRNVQIELHEDPENYKFSVTL